MSAMSLWETVDTFESPNSAGGAALIKPIGWPLLDSRGGNIFIPKRGKKNSFLYFIFFFFTLVQKRHQISVWYSTMIFYFFLWRDEKERVLLKSKKKKGLLRALFSAGKTLKLDNLYCWDRAEKHTWDFKGVKLWSKRTWTYLSGS